MGPAGSFDDVAAAVDFRESRIAVGLQNAVKVTQMLLRVLSVAIGTVREPNCRRGLARRRPLVAHIRPQPPGLGFSAARSKHRNRRIVCVDDIGGKDVRTERLRQRNQQRTDAADPLRQQRAIEFNAFARVDLRLPIEWQMIGVFADQHVRQEAWSGHPAFDRTRWRRRLHDHIATRTRQLGAYLVNDFEAHRLELQHVAGVLAEVLELAAAIRTRGDVRSDRLRFAC